jgi:hypothetical protein
LHVPFELLKSTTSRFSKQEVMRLVCAALEQTKHEVNGKDDALELHVVNISDDYKKDKDAFARAVAIISPHGGALGNLMFALPDTLLVELVDITTGNLCFFGMARMMNLRYEAVTPSK